MLICYNDYSLLYKLILVCRKMPNRIQLFHSLIESWWYYINCYFVLCPVLNTVLIFTNIHIHEILFYND